MGKRTPLYEAHVAAGAKLVDFAGWDMPLHYGSQVDEHHAVRRSAGMFDVAHMLIVDLRGEAVRRFLRYLLANNVDKLREPGKALYTCMLRHDGRVIDDLIVYFLDEASFRVVVNAATAETDLAWIQEQAAAFDGAVEIVPRRDLAILAVQGPEARRRLWDALPGTQAATQALKPFAAVQSETMLLARTGYTGEDGFELMLPGAEAMWAWTALRQAGVAPAGLGARDTLRLEAGMNLYGQDMDESVTPLESGLRWTVDLASPRDFIGKTVLQERAPRFQMVGLVLIDKGVLRAHQTVFTQHGEGMVTSGSFAPTLGLSVALARIPPGPQAGENVEVEIRAQRLSARIVRPPFVRNGKVLVTA